MKPRIDISNYEEFVMDYLEGTLSEDLYDDFRAFLLKHPDVAIEIESLMESPMTLETPEWVVNKADFKIDVTPVSGVNEENYEEVFALASSKEMESMQGFVKANPVLKRDFDLYKAARLKPDESIVYPWKSTLKQPVPLWDQLPTVAYRVAAVLVLALGAFTAFQLIQDAAYSPRNGVTEFAFSVGDEQPVLTDDKTDELVANADLEQVDRNVPKKRSREMVALMKHPQLDKSQELPVIDYRDDQWVAQIEEPVHVPTLVGAQHKTPELSIAQYLGREILGVNPQEAPTTKAVLKEGAKKVINKNDQIAINSVESEDDRKTVEVLAGIFEFRRVTYHSN